MGCGYSCSVWWAKENSASVQFQLNRAFIATEAFAKRFEENATRMEALANFIKDKLLAEDIAPGETRVMSANSPHYESAKDIILIHKEEFSGMYNKLIEASPSNAPIELFAREWQKILEYSHLYLGAERVYAVYYRTQAESQLHKAHQDAWATSAANVKQPPRSAN
jgi:hypothetical protein